MDTASDPIRERDLEELGITASVKTVLGQPGKAIVEIDATDLDRLTGQARQRGWG